MLVELPVVEQRYLAVREVLDTGASITDVAIRYGVDRRTLHRWLVRYANEGLSALADRSSRPDRCPHQIEPRVEALIVSMRRAHPGWGPRTILSKLRLQLERPPSRSAIYRCLVRHRLIEPSPRRRSAKDYRRWERARAMELWQLDVMGARLADGTWFRVVTGLDDHSGMGRRITSPLSHLGPQLRKEPASCSEAASEPRRALPASCSGRRSDIARCVHRAHYARWTARVHRNRGQVSRDHEESRG